MSDIIGHIYKVRIMNGQDEKETTDKPKERRQNQLDSQDREETVWANKKEIMSRPRAL